MDIAIIVALQEEFPIKINPFPEYTFYTGIGKVNAAISATRIVERYDPKLIINIGTAGSCLSKLQGLVECGVFIDRDIDERLTDTKKIITDRNKAVISSEIWEENIKNSHPSFIKVIYDYFQNSV